MKNKKDAVKKFLAEKNVVILSESGTDRNAIKKVFIDLGVKSVSVENCTTVEEVQVQFATKQVDIFFTAYELGFDLIDEHIFRFPDRSDYFCFVISDKNSMALAASVAEKEIDGFIVKPYNQGNLEESIFHAINRGISISSEMRLYNKIRGQIRVDKLDKAEEGANKFIVKRPNSANGYYLRGLIKKKLGQTQEAIGIWNMGLDKDENNHQILCSLFDTYCESKMFVEAYAIAEVLTTKFPINPHRIPNFIRASLATENYDNLLTFCNTIVDVNDDLTAIKKPIAAALAICGKSLLGGNFGDKNKIIISVSKKAIALCEIQSNIYITSIENLLGIKEFELVREYIDQIPTDEQVDRVLVIDLHVNEALESEESTYIKAQNLIKLNKVDPDIYNIALTVGKKLDKPGRQLNDIAFEGTKHYPDMKDKFLGIINK